MLKLDFNERSDKSSTIVQEYSFGDKLWQYPDRLPLENKIAFINQLNPSQVLCTNGGDEAIMLLMRLVKEKYSLILPLPAFSQYTQGVKSWDLNSEMIQAKINDSQSELLINIEKIKQSIQQTKNTVTIITRPNNPTGELISFENLLDCLELAKANDSWIFLDEAYIEFSNEKNKSISLLSQFDNLVILRTFSKAYGLAGIRMGYLLGGEKLIKEFKDRCMPFNVSTPNISIALEALSQENIVETKSYCKKIIDNRNTMINWLNLNGIKTVASQANFILLQLPFGQAQAIASFLKKNKILVRRFTETELVDCVRITIPYDIENLFKLIQQCIKPKLICLDMDGVLINATDSYDQSIKATVEYFSKKIISQIDIEQCRNQGGFNNDWKLTQQLLSNLGFNIDLDSIIEIFQQVYHGPNNDGYKCNETGLINSSIKQLFDKIKWAKFAIVTGRPFIEAQSAQKMLALDNFDLISLDDVTQPKPSPEGILKLQKKYSMQSWMCGDNVDDMQAATGSNSLAIGISTRNQKSNKQALYDAGADFVFDDINQLEDWICL